MTKSKYLSTTVTEVIVRAKEIGISNRVIGKLF